jgi:hypothetical protein
MQINRYYQKLPSILQIRRVLAIVIAGILLSFSTACNNGNLQGARPENPPVQLGGQNNPHKMQGDKYTDYKAPTNPQLDKNASLPSNLSNLIAAYGVEEKKPGLIYKNDTRADENYPIKSDKTGGVEIPAKQQTIIDRSDPDANILEKTGKAFEEASEFLEGSTKQLSPES